jgi:hypothetical protein
MGIRRPIESDFEVVCHASAVEVTFKPTRSHYTFNLLADEKGIARLDRLSPDVHVRHAGVTGDTGEYPSSDVRLMARRLAEQALRSGR